MIKFENYTMPAADIGKLNPMPDIKNVSYIHAGYKMTDKIKEEEKTYLGKGMISTMLPYMMQDGYNRSKKDRNFKAAILENDYIKAVFLPEIGGRLWSLYDKKLKGRKLFVWGMGQGGRNWGEWLSVENSSYIEIQAGLAHTQLEHIPMKGNTTWEWTEGYTSVSLESSVAHGDYSAAVSEVDKFLENKVGNLEAMPFPKEIKSSEIIYKGSGWGAVEEAIKGEKISSLCTFSKADDGECDDWWQLIEKGTFPCPDVNEEPKSYVKGNFWAEKLLALPQQSWYSLLHLGVIYYAAGDIEKAKEAWEESIKLTPSPWAIRNLAMLYKNELGESQKATELLLKAFELKSDCRALCCEIGAHLTSCGEDEKWISIYNSLSEELKNIGRIRLLYAVALLNLGKYTTAAEIINPDFVMDDIKEGELSVSHIWFQLYRRLYAEEEGIAYDENDTALQKAADEKYPLPKKLDFRMHD